MQHCHLELSILRTFFQRKQDFPILFLKFKRKEIWNWADIKKAIEGKDTIIKKRNNAVGDISNTNHSFL